MLVSIANEMLGELARAVGLAISDETISASDAVWRLLTIVSLRRRWKLISLCRKGRHEPSVRRSTHRPHHAAVEHPRSPRLRDWGAPRAADGSKSPSGTNSRVAASFRKKARKQGLTFLDRTAGPQLISLLEQTRQTVVDDQREKGKRKGDENVDPADHLDCEVMLDVIINSIFDLVDADDSGELDEDEMRVCLGLLGLSSTPTDVHRAMASVDIDRSDTISRDEFYSFIYLGFLRERRTHRQTAARARSL